MESILVDIDELLDNLHMYHSVLQTAREGDLDSPDGGAMRQELAVSVNIALRKAVGKQKFTDQTRYKIIAELLGMRPEVVDTVYVMGRSAAVAFLEFCYGKDVDLHTNPPVKPEMRDVIQFLYLGAVEVVVA